MRNNPLKGSIMHHTAWTRPVTVAGLLAMATLGLSVRAAALEAHPTAITFERAEQPVEVRLTHDGQPLAPGDFQGWAFLVGEHTYEHMMEVSRTENGVQVKPTDQAEVGSYELVLKTVHGNVSIAVYTPLRDLASSLDNRAAELGISVEALKKQLGIGARAYGRERVTVEMPSVVYVGKSIIVPMSPPEGRRYEWTLNGKVLMEGEDDHELRHTFTEAGLYVFEYHEYEGDSLVASGQVIVTAIPEKPVTGAVERGAPLEFFAPEGYRLYAWRVNGEPRGDDAVLQCRLFEPGLHSISVQARNPEPGEPMRFRQVEYRILVM